jgi:hypothetical protein
MVSAYTEIISIRVDDTLLFKIKEKLGAIINSQSFHSMIIDKVH